MASTSVGLSPGRLGHPMRPLDARALVYPHGRRGVGLEEPGRQDSIPCANFDSVDTRENGKQSLVERLDGIFLLGY